MRTLLTAKRHTASDVSPGAKWQQAVSSTTWPHLPFILAIAVYSCSIKFFHLKRALGLALGELGPCLRNHRKTLMSTKACFRGKAFPGKPAKITLGENKDVNSWIKFRLYNTSFWASEKLVPWERTPWHWSKHVKFTPIMTVPQRLSFSAQLTNSNVGPCCHVMAHIGACWHSIFSTLHSLGQ